MGHVGVAGSLASVCSQQSTSYPTTLLQPCKRPSQHKVHLLSPSQFMCIGNQHVYVCATPTTPHLKSNVTNSLASCSQPSHATNHHNQPSQLNTQLAPKPSSADKLYNSTGSWHSLTLHVRRCPTLVCIHGRYLTKSNNYLGFSKKAPSTQQSTLISTVGHHVIHRHNTTSQ